MARARARARARGLDRPEPGCVVWSGPTFIKFGPSTPRFKREAFERTPRRKLGFRAGPVRTPGHDRGAGKMSKKNNLGKRRRQHEFELQSNYCIPDRDDLSFHRFSGQFRARCSHFSFLLRIRRKRREGEESEEATGDEIQDEGQIGSSPRHISLIQLFSISFSRYFVGCRRPRAGGSIRYASVVSLSQY